jgi:hypothetical protein
MAHYSYFFLDFVTRWFILISAFIQSSPCPQFLLNFLLKKAGAFSLYFSNKKSYIDVDETSPLLHFPLSLILSRGTFSKFPNTKCR